MQAWGAVNYHNAVILCRESGIGEEKGDPEVVTVKSYLNVFILPPVIKTTKTLRGVL